MNKISVEALLEKYLSGSLSEEERVQLNRMLEEKQHQEQLEAILDKELEEHTFESDEDSALLGQIQENVQKAIRREEKSAKVVRMNWRRMAVAAVFILLLGSGAFWLWKSQKTKQEIAISTQPKVNKDIAPGSNKAILRLADGTEIVLDSARKGTLAQQDMVKIIMLDNGQVSYHSQNGKPNEILYNTITTPKGGQYQLVLADGTKVWLNAASSLHFPAAFAGKERVVELKGEGYFEVARNITMPFHVRVNGTDIQVLGTHFNINAYNNESAMLTTLLEGSVKVSKGTQTRMLKPGQQAAIGRGEQILVENDVNLDEVIAWKNGLFQFQSADLETILRQASRWYDIEVEYRDKISERFSGQISRNVNISQLLKILELTGKVQFEIEGRKIIVKS
ncbi:FecR domain-containing protein [Chitinophagaceae bacterium LB-8]|uniref:FecR domain-containing protein n=1 Tax=Paraflavisolibacter caeni TaxID=2982496 RepID=A0A9X2XNE3_9BACT|nr:FecR family protein [Paraflavisolibacter caeni]MCU7547979.1 FecR domain-containing protein [Paraflavisolibacter caeni]